MTTVTFTHPHRPVEAVGTLGTAQNGKRFVEMPTMAACDMATGTTITVDGQGEEVAGLGSEYRNRAGTLVRRVYLVGGEHAPKASATTYTRCAECNGSIRGGGTKRRDSSGIVGLCCPRCARLSEYELSFA